MTAILRAATRFLFLRKRASDSQTATYLETKPVVARSRIQFAFQPVRQPSVPCRVSTMTGTRHAHAMGLANKLLQNICECTIRNFSRKSNLAKRAAELTCLG